MLRNVAKTIACVCASHIRVYNYPVCCVSGLQMIQFWWKATWLVLAPAEAANHPIPWPLPQHNPGKGTSATLQIQFPTIGSLVQNEFLIIGCITHCMNSRLRNRKSIFQHLNIVTAVNVYEMMLLLALKCCPGLWTPVLVMNQQIVEVLDTLISNAAYTGREE